MANVLIVDDDRMICDVLATKVQSMGSKALCAFNLHDAMCETALVDFDVVFLDVMLPDGNGLDRLSLLKNLPSSPEIIIMTGKGDRDGAELAINNGAWDYIEKPSSLGEMTLPLLRALKYREAVQAQEPKKTLDREGIVGNSAAVRLCLEQAAQAADSLANVLITGETGTGKELFAWAIHQNSARSRKNFVVVDCASLTETLVECMLFGHEKGAYTGAEKASEGLIKQADGGTLFLDEVGELPLTIQKAFLRVLQERRYRPLGSPQEVTSHFRLIAATHRNLEQMTQQGLFRSDLLYRLRSFAIELPPLRNHPEDIGELALHYMAKFCTRQGIAVKHFSPDFLEALTRYAWPGNVRELALTMERAIAVAGREATIYPKHLPTDIRIKMTQAAIQRPPAPAEETLPALPAASFPTLQDFRDQAIDSAEAAYLKNLLAYSDRRMTQAARTAGLSRSRLYELLRKHGIGSGSLPAPPDSPRD